MTLATPEATAADTPATVATGPVTESDVDFVEVEVEDSYTEQGAVSEADGDQQQIEAVSGPIAFEFSEEDQVLIARADFNSDITVIGVTWDASVPAPAEVNYRYLYQGVWTEWSALGFDAPSESDFESSTATREGTEPVTLPNADAVEVVVRGALEETADSITLNVIDPRGQGEVDNSLAELVVDDADDQVEPDDQEIDEQQDENVDEGEEGSEPPNSNTQNPDTQNPGTQDEEESLTELDDDQLLDLDGVASGEPASFSALMSAVVPVALNSAGTVYTTELDGLKINTRKAWGANESWMTWKAEPITIKGAVVHHTEGNNNYTQAQVAGQIQGVYRYHAVTLGWGDIGYNLIVDKYGGVWEGRAGGLTKGVKGAHAYGANSDTFGISVLGSYMTSAPPAAAQTAVAKAVAWKLYTHGIKTTKSTIYVPGSDLKGRNVQLVSGHRDVGATDCPGDAFYARMSSLRTSTESYLTQLVKQTSTTPGTGTTLHPSIAGWDYGLIMPDANFYKPNAMTENQIKTFIQTEGKDCKGNSSAGTTCLKDSTFPTQKLTTLRGGCQPLNLTGKQTPWKIISETSKACGLNPQVILVMIQKESSGIYQPRTASAWAKAMGNSCPTGQQCDASQAGFQKQVYYGADKLVSYKLQPTWWPYIAAVDSKKAVTMPYSSDSSCGGETFVMKNYATASLYTYNPFAPNSATLNAYPSSGGSCSHTGNLNFYKYMKQWFPESMADGGGSSTTKPTTPTTPTKPTTPTTPTPPAASVSWKPTIQIGHGWRTTVIHPGDFNGNGYPDLMLVNSSGKLMFYAGRAGERFANPVQIGHGWQTIDWVQGGVDWDGDGNMDLVARVKDTGELRLYPGNGRGGFKAAKKIGQGWNGISQMTLTRTAKGPAIYAIVGDTLRYYPSNGRGGFSARKDVSTGWKDVTYLAGVGDWTGDGRPDLLTRDKGGILYLHPGKADGTPGAGARVGHGWNSTKYIEVASQSRAKSALWAVRSDGTLHSYKIR